MKRWLIILFLMSLLLTFYEITVSYGLFETERDIVVNSDIGKFQIKLNDELINETTAFSVSNITVSGDSNVRQNHFAPGTNGYFDIVIDPNDSDVSIYYEIVCHSDLIQNDNIHLTRIENVGKSDLTLVGPNTYIAIIPLSDIKNHDITTIRFYVEWVNDESNNDVDSMYGNSSTKFDIPMEITFRQYTG